MWFGPVNQDGTMRKHRPATNDDKWGRPNSVQDMSAEPCRGSNEPFAWFGCDAQTVDNTQTTEPATDQGAAAVTEGMNKHWQKREIAEHLIKAAGDLIENWDQGGDIEADYARECIARWLKSLPSAAWDDRLGPRPEAQSR